MTVSLASVEAKTADPRRQGLQDRGTGGSGAQEVNAFSGVLAGIADVVPQSTELPRTALTETVANLSSLKDEIPSLASLLEGTPLGSATTSTGPLKTHTSAATADESTSQAAANGLTPDPILPALQLTAVFAAGLVTATSSPTKHSLSGRTAVDGIDRRLSGSTSRDNPAATGNIDARTNARANTIGDPLAAETEKPIASVVQVETHMTVATSIDRSKIATASDVVGAGRSVDATTLTAASSGEQKSATSNEPLASSAVAKSAEPDTTVVPATVTPGQAMIQVVTRAISAASSSSHAAASSVPALTSSVPTAPRVMVLQLTPASLGTVNVTLRLVGHALDLRIAVSDTQTLGTIDRDRAALSDAVRAQGYEVRSLVVQSYDATATSTGDPNASSGQTGDQTSAGADRRSSQSGHGTPHDDPSKPQSNTTRTSDDDPVRTRTAAGAGALFV